MPESVISALGYLLPALFGALLVQFGMKSKGHTALILVIAVLINVGLKGGIFNWLPGASNYLGILASVFLSIAVAVATYNKKQKTQKTSL